MDILSDDLIISIAAKVVAHSVHDLFHFMRTNKRHSDLCRSRGVSRAFGNDFLGLLTDLGMNHEKLDFMQRLWNAGNPWFYILRSTQQLLHASHNFAEINRLLTNAVNAGSYTVR